jgi:DUF1680 family protein
LLSLPGYVATTSADGLWLHQYLPGVLRHGPSRIRIETDYPIEGAVQITILEAAPLPALFLRIPGWCQGATVSVNGAALDCPAGPGTYAAVHALVAGDTVALNLPLPARRVYAHPKVAANSGRTALARGPIVYCIEGADHPGVDLRQVELPADADLSHATRSELLGGVSVVLAAGIESKPVGGALYTSGRSARTQRPISLTAVPYYAWANRGPGQMQVWLKEATEAALAAHG